LAYPVGSQLLGDFIEVEARALSERDQDDIVKVRFAVAALAHVVLAFGTGSGRLLVVTQRRCRHGGALGHLRGCGLALGGQVIPGKRTGRGLFARDRLGKIQGCKTPFDATGVS